MTPWEHREHPGIPCSAVAGGELRTQIQVLHTSWNNEEWGRISGIWRWWEQGAQPEQLGLLHPSAGNSCPSQGSHRSWGASWEGGGAPGRLGSPGKVGDPWLIQVSVVIPSKGCWKTSG